MQCHEGRCCRKRMNQYKYALTLELCSTFMCRDTVCKEWLYSVVKNQALIHPSRYWNQDNTQGCFQQCACIVSLPSIMHAHINGSMVYVPPCIPGADVRERRGMCRQNVSLRWWYLVGIVLIHSKRIHILFHCVNCLWKIVHSTNIPTLCMTGR